MLQYTEPFTSAVNSWGPQRFDNETNPPLCTNAKSFYDSHVTTPNTFWCTTCPYSRLSLELTLAGLARSVGGNGGRERGLVVEVGFGDVVEGFAVGFPRDVIGGLLAEDAADGLVVEELGAAEEEGGLEAGPGDLVGL